jgi:hypothetical protein
MSVGSSTCVGKIYSSHWYKVPKIMVYETMVVYSHLPSDCKARTHESLFNTLLLPEFIFKRLHFNWLCKEPKYE